MYRAAAIPLATAPLPGLQPLPLRLALAIRREFGPGDREIDVPELHRYFADLSRGHEIGFRPSRVTRARGNPFLAMARELLAGQLSGERIDLAIVAHAAPEFDPRLSAPVNLTAVLPGGPLGFSVSGQGGLAPFSALKIAGSYVRRHGFRRVLVLITDQGVTPYDTPERIGDAATALLFEAGGGRAVSVGYLPDVAPDAVPATVAGFGSPDTVVIGSGLARTGSRPGAIVAPAGFPCTGLWAPLADGTATGAVLLADYDPRHRALGVCVVAESD
ncbi:hypothetical protein Q5425_34115 [Amycolatopsis sp. A133]|uniref:hypothetical protein n=1 Tax=Amycolatopsis sp. A133 TaxID=3064472 RepID=UPI0027F2B8ED|nr:hypothetical protein [Amycolatopsis sp. A133]MDQ7808799.1 hypothetical protein [Amycolatopsis sp. A133]